MISGWILSFTLLAYTVGPGDVLAIEVKGQEELSGKYEIQPDGTVELELVGSLQLANQTIDDVDALVTESFTKYLREPNVVVRVASYGSHKVYLLGAVKKPGRYVLKDEQRILDVLMEAGGPNTHQATLHLVRTVDDDIASRHVALRGLLVDGDMTDNFVLESGDILTVVAPIDSSGVASDEQRITVVGEVKQPGMFRLESGATAMAAVLAAGGLTQYAGPKRAKVVRNSPKGRKVMKVDLAAIMKKGHKDQDVTLQPGDMVIVPGRRL